MPYVTCCLQSDRYTVIHHIFNLIRLRSFLCNIVAAVTNSSIVPSLELLRRQLYNALRFMLHLILSYRSIVDLCMNNNSCIFLTAKCTYCIT